MISGRVYKYYDVFLVLKPLYDVHLCLFCIELNNNQFIFVIIKDIRLISTFVLAVPVVVFKKLFCLLRFFLYISLFALDELICILWYLPKCYKFVPKILLYIFIHNCAVIYHIICLKLFWKGFRLISVRFCASDILNVIFLNSITVWATIRCWNMNLISEVNTHVFNVTSQMLFVC